MTGYSSDPTQLLGTIVATLTHRVLPEVPDGQARLELGAVLEQLGNLVGRVGWDGARLGAVCARTEELARELGLPGAVPEPTVAALRARRAQIAEALAGTYSGGAPGPAAAAVAAFTAEDVADQITGALRGAFAPEETAR
ncbi:hypothetical protein [Nocardia sp. NPDC057353]|uniref:hypothetical protein n=1 Tax=Nocardia sp. NPDC057353 TaxID=3346104 RepID=UPI00362694EC